MTDANVELLEAQAHLARLFERDARYADAEALLKGMWDEPMPSTTRYEIGTIYARVLRLRDKWAELDTLVNSLVQSAEAEGDTENLAQVLVLRMEAALCAYPNHPKDCIETADLLMSISQDPDLTFRALGHKGLAFLALGDTASARRFIDEGIQAAESYGEPYAVFLAWHFRSQLSIATLDLTSATEIGRKLVDISEADAVARDELFHLRDLGRAELLAGHPDDAAQHIASFLHVNKRKYERDRAIAYVVMMVNEARDINSPATAGEFLAALASCVEEQADDSEIVGVIAQMEAAPYNTLDLDPANFVDDSSAIKASERIFCFNCDCLGEIRQNIVAKQLMNDSDQHRPMIIIDLDGALSYFRGVFAEFESKDSDPRLSLSDMEMLRQLESDFDIRITQKEA